MNFIQITLKGDVKYQIGIDKTVDQVLKEVGKSKGDFYRIIPTCAIKISEIISVEKIEIKEGVNTDV